ncbi:MULTISPECIES: aldehyde dehydrogenase (NADP(+)) [unclassified Beijerinckia]|uniref:aldehyde dehydrogenase (NADP(+)) n=1 Tax=unclassified Beijerinckia TaxID=2638183 RepID=UPI00089855B9|nr:MULTISPECIES: aldehyde dehydrogenase (NADP(+)) [unclassified Beijerinckia]MDH7798842.1 alpha-ketoglutaric semialdehyde dehydrogenase [Beijerinckia sp. GAS462]SED89223.1 NADP-dependent aldehyde dehydrogenase [Beijerinckia sp. 28-YEA-48]
MLNGEMLIGSKSVRGSQSGLRAVNPSTGEGLDPPYPGASLRQLDEACALAAAAFDPYRNLPREKRATFLEAIATNILDLGDALIERAMAETSLPRVRLEGERGRTVGQLRLFAQVVRDGHYLELRVDPAQPDRQPLPRSDLRLRKIPLGPVAIFGASNFPLAFSVAGGDTASALAAGCPVVCKAHPAHPGTSELVGRAIQKAVKDGGLPEGVFSLLFDSGHEIGQALVSDPRITAVGFTGSRRGGLALMAIAQRRAEPIPVYAEMSSINPVLLFPAALAERSDKIAAAFVASLTMGAGQFCTNPGLIIALDGKPLDMFLEQAGRLISGAGATTMLTPGIHQAYESGVSALDTHDSVRTIARGQQGGRYQCIAGLFTTTAEVFLADAKLAEEVFGASSLIVRCRDSAEIARVLLSLEGQLTAALHIADADHDEARKLLPLLERKVGRILVNGFGTGVEVAHAMVHGGPFPATSDSRTTSVGSLAIERFLRPVCYQDMPDVLLPPDLRDANVVHHDHLRDGRAILGH